MKSSQSKWRSRAQLALTSGTLLLILILLWRPRIQEATCQLRGQACPEPLQNAIHSFVGQRRYFATHKEKMQALLTASEELEQYQVEQISVSGKGVLNASFTGGNPEPLLPNTEAFDAQSSTETKNADEQLLVLITAWQSSSADARLREARLLSSKDGIQLQLADGKQVLLPIEAVEAKLELLEKLMQTARFRDLLETHSVLDLRFRNPVLRP